MTGGLATRRLGRSRVRGSGRAWAWLFSVTLILVVCIRFFSEDVHLAPGMVQFIDVPLTMLIACVAFLAFVRRGLRADGLKLRLILYLFLSLTLVSCLVNPVRVSLYPGLMFYFGFACPLIIAAAMINARLEREDVNLSSRPSSGWASCSWLSASSGTPPASLPPPIPTSCRARSGRTLINSCTSSDSGSSTCSAGRF